MGPKFPLVPFFSRYDEFREACFGSRVLYSYDEETEEKEPNGVYPNGRNCMSSLDASTSLSCSGAGTSLPRVSLGSRKEGVYRPMVFIDEGMGPLYRAGFVQDKDFGCTVDEYYQTFAARLRKIAVSHRDIGLAILVFDRSEYKPRLKDETVAKRSQQVDPYPKEWVLRWDGLHTDASSSSAASHHPAVEPRIFPTRLLRGPNHVRQLLTLFEERLARDETLSCIPWILDYLPEGPRLVWNGRIETKSEWRHELGEADLSVVWWRQRYAHCHILLESADLDVLLLALLHSEGRNGWTPASREGIFHLVVTRADENDPAWVVDIPRLRFLMEQSGWNVSRFVLGVILCGTDFVEKSVLCSYQNDERIVEACGHSIPSVPTTTASLTSASASSHSAAADRASSDRIFTELDAVLSNPTDLGCMYSFLEALRDRSASGKRAYTIAASSSSEAIRRGWMRVLANWMYWASLQNIASHTIHTRCPGFLTECATEKVAFHTQSSYTSHQKSTPSYSTPILP